MHSDLKLHDKLTGLKLCAIRVPGAVKPRVQYRFEAPYPIPDDLVPENQCDTRANVAAFAKINQYLKNRIVLLD